MAMRRRVTFSRNLTLSLSRTCRCYCKYCAFATHRAHLYTPEETLEILDGAARRQVKELLVLTGERPEVNPQVAARLREHGHEDFTAYVAWTCERALERGLLPHTNLGVLSREDLVRLREVTASQGLMLESVSERLMDTVHAGSPTKHPARRLETIRAAGELRIPFTSGILVGIGETERERIESLEALAAAEHVRRLVTVSRAHVETGVGAAGRAAPTCREERSAADEVDSDVVAGEPERRRQIHLRRLRIHAEHDAIGRPPECARLVHNTTRGQRARDSAQRLP